LLRDELLEREAFDTLLEATVLLISFIVRFGASNDRSLPWSGAECFESPGENGDTGTWESASYPFELASG
jgi:hypothetical protein